MAAGVRIFAGGGFEMHIDVDDISDEGFLRILKTVQYAMYVIEFALVDFLLYHRIKTIKQ